MFKLMTARLVKGDVSTKEPPPAHFQPIRKGHAFQQYKPGAGMFESSVESPQSDPCASAASINQDYLSCEGLMLGKQGKDQRCSLPGDSSSAEPTRLGSSVLRHLQETCHLDINRYPHEASGYTFRCEAGTQLSEHKFFQSSSGGEGHAMDEHYEGNGTNNRHQDDVIVPSRPHQTSRHGHPSSSTSVRNSHSSRSNQRNLYTSFREFNNSSPALPPARPVLSVCTRCSQEPCCCPGTPKTAAFMKRIRALKKEIRRRHGSSSSGGGSCSGSNSQVSTRDDMEQSLLNLLQTLHPTPNSPVGRRAARANKAKRRRPKTRALRCPRCQQPECVCPKAMCTKCNNDPCTCRRGKCDLCKKPSSECRCHKTSACHMCHQNPCSCSKSRVTWGVPSLSHTTTDTYQTQNNQRSHLESPMWVSEYT